MCPSKWEILSFAKDQGRPPISCRWPSTMHGCESRRWCYGDDLLASTPRQLLLYRALKSGVAALSPHRLLVVGEDGLRLAKRHGDSRIATFRERGVRPERLVGQLAFWSGLAAAGTECLPRDIVAKFDWDRVPKERIVCERGVLSTF